MTDEAVNISGNRRRPIIKQVAIRCAIGSGSKLRVCGFATWDSNNSSSSSSKRVYSTGYDSVTRLTIVWRESQLTNRFQAKYTGAVICHGKLRVRFVLYIKQIKDLWLEIFDVGRHFSRLEAEVTSRNKFNEKVVNTEILLFVDVCLAIRIIT